MTTDEIAAAMYDINILGLHIVGEPFALFTLAAAVVTVRFLAWRA